MPDCFERPMVASAGWARARRLDVRKEAVSGDSCGYSAGASGGLVQRSRRINSLKSGGPMPQSGSFLPWPCNWPRKLVENPRVRVTLAVSRARGARDAIAAESSHNHFRIPKTTFSRSRIHRCGETHSLLLPLPSKPCAGAPTATGRRSRRRRMRRKSAGSICPASSRSTFASRWAGSPPCGSDPHSGSPPAIQLL